MPRCTWKKHTFFDDSIGATYVWIQLTTPYNSNYFRKYVRLLCSYSNTETICWIGFVAVGRILFLCGEEGRRFELRAERNCSYFLSHAVSCNRVQFVSNCNFHQKGSYIPGIVLFFYLHWLWSICGPAAMMHDKRTNRWNSRNCINVREGKDFAK